MSAHSPAPYLSAATLFVFLSGCSETTQPDPRTAAPLVRTAVIQPATVATRTFTGIVAAQVQSDLGFRVAGKVSERLVSAGQTVKRGQTLMRLDPADFRLVAEAQRQVVAAARAKAVQTAEDETRYRELRGTGAVSLSSYDQAKAAAEAAQAQLSTAIAQSQVAANSTRYADLVADADGVVMDTMVEPGQVVASGQIVLRIARAGRREALIQLPETIRPAIGSTAMATLYGSDGTRAPARLRLLSDTADRQTRTFEARYTLDAALTDAPLGSTVTMQLGGVAPTGEASFAVPIGSLFDKGQGHGVWVVGGDPARVAWRPVSVRTLQDDTATVSGPLREGSAVVALGAQLLRDGEAVRLAAPGPASARGRQ